MSSAGNTNIVRAHRLPPRKPRRAPDGTITPSEPPAIIAKLYREPLKKALISASIQKKPTTVIFGQQPGSRIYFNGHLLKETQSLFNSARFRLIKEPVAGLKYFSVKCRDGKIFVKKSENARPIVISSVEDLNRLLPFATFNSTDFTR